MLLLQKKNWDKKFVYLHRWSISIVQQKKIDFNTSLQYLIILHRIFIGIKISEKVTWRSYKDSVLKLKLAWYFIKEYKNTYHTNSAANHWLNRWNWIWLIGQRELRTCTDAWHSALAGIFPILLGKLFSEEVANYLSRNVLHMPNL